MPQMFASFVVTIGLISLLLLTTDITRPVQSRILFSESFDSITSEKSDGNKHGSEKNSGVIEDVFVSKRWKKSSATKYASQSIKIAVPLNSVEGFEADKSLILDAPHSHYGVYSELSNAATLGDGKDLVIQYEVKLEEQHTCGGAYLKLPRYSDKLDLTGLNNDTPYSIMFGPDKCGGTNKVHFIVQVQNPVSKVWKEHHYKEVVTMANDRKTHLYSLHLKANGDFDLYLDNNKAKSGSLRESMDPPIEPPRTIDDVTDVKPANWIDQQDHPDPSAVKPDDWDESAPRMIEDVTATKPAGWLDDAPLKVPDPEAIKPEDWDDEEDGEFIAPEVDNPACSAHGCGVWKTPMVKNPAFKGVWKAPLVKNPDYKGPWKAREVDNPEYYEVTSYAKAVPPIAAVAVEVWTVNRGVAFDNIIIADSINDAKLYSKTTYDVEATKEKVVSEARAQEEVLKVREEKRKQGASGALEASVADFIDYSVDNPLQMVGAFVGLVIAGFFLCSGPAAKKKLPKVPEQVAESVSEGASDEQTEEVVGSTEKSSLKNDSGDENKSK